MRVNERGALGLTSFGFDLGLSLCCANYIYIILDGGDD